MGQNYIGKIVRLSPSIGRGFEVSVRSKGPFSRQGGRKRNRLRVVLAAKHEAAR
jgi:hypothetical protein